MCNCSVHSLSMSGTLVLLNLVKKSTVSTAAPSPIEASQSRMGTEASFSEAGS